VVDFGVLEDLEGELLYHLLNVDRFDIIDFVAVSQPNYRPVGLILMSIVEDLLANDGSDGLVLCLGLLPYRIN
jgi:hypothetical protein